MKNKKFTYVLIPVVLIVWGMIIYRLFNGTNSGLAINKNENKLFEKNVNETMADTFSIRGNYKDPFLSKRSQRNQIQETTIKQPTTNETKKLKPEAKNNKSLVTWPNVVFSGLIKNQKSNKQLALLQIDGKADIMQVGDTKSNIKLLKTSHDSIEISFNAEHKVIRK